MKADDASADRKPPLKPAYDQNGELIWSRLSWYMRFVVGFIRGANIPVFLLGWWRFGFYGGLASAAAAGLLYGFYAWLLRGEFLDARRGE